MSTDDPTDPRDETVARMLDDPAVWADVPAGLRDRVTAAAREAVADGQHDDEGHGGERHIDPRHGDEPHGDEPPGGARPAGAATARPPRPSSPAPTELDVHRRRRRPLMVAAAAVLVACVGLAGALMAGRGDSDTDAVEVALAGTDEAPGAAAVVRLRDEPAGVSVRLVVDTLEPAPEGTFYEAWLVGESGKVSAGTFHLRGDQDEIELWLGVDTTGYEAVTVTRQPVAGGSLADGVVVLRGELPDGG